MLLFRSYVNDRYLIVLRGAEERTYLYGGGVDDIASDPHPNTATVNLQPHLNAIEDHYRKC